MANHRKKPIDPSKPLPNPKHEIIAKEIASGQNQTDAYMKAYPKSSLQTARANASTVVEQAGINARALKLLERNGISEDKLASKLGECLDSETENIKLDATKTGFKLLGYGSEQKLAETSYNPVQINFIVRSNRGTNDTKPNDTIEIQQVDE